MSEQHAVKVEEQVRVENKAPGSYIAQLWVGDRYFRATGQTEDEARGGLPRVIYEAHAQGEDVDPNDLPVAVRKAVAAHGVLMADLARRELLRLTAYHLHFAPDPFSKDERAADDPTVYVLSPLEVAANCIHRGADLADTDPALLPNVLTWFHAEITAREYEAACLRRRDDTQAANEVQAEADALKEKLAHNGTGRVTATSNGWSSVRSWVTATSND